MEKVCEKPRLGLGGSMRRCFGVLFCGAKAGDEGEARVSSGVRFISAGFFAVALAAMLWGIEAYADGRDVQEALWWFRRFIEGYMLELGSLLWAALLLEAPLYWLRVAVAKKQLAESEEEYALVGDAMACYSFFIWIVYAITAGVVMFSGSYLLGYAALTALQAPVLLRVCGMMGNMREKNRKARLLKAGALFLRFNIAWVILLLLGGLPKLLFWMS